MSICNELNKTSLSNLKGCPLSYGANFLFNLKKLTSLLEVSSSSNKVWIPNPTPTCHIKPELEYIYDGLPTVLKKKAKC
jgi:hypothetical protein